MIESRKLSEVRFICQGYPFTAAELTETAIMASGGNITSGYFELMDMQISEFFFVTEAWLRVAKRKAEAEKKAAGGRGGSKSLGSMEQVNWVDE